MPGVVCFVVLPVCLVSSVLCQETGWKKLLVILYSIICIILRLAVLVKLLTRDRHGATMTSRSKNVVCQLQVPQMVSDIISLLTVNCILILCDIVSSLLWHWLFSVLTHKRHVQLPWDSVATFRIFFGDCSIIFQDLWVLHVCLCYQQSTVTSQI